MKNTQRLNRSARESVYFHICIPAYNVRQTSANVNTVGECFLLDVECSSSCVTYKPMTFFPVFGWQKKRHTNLWLFSQFSDGKKNDIQTYDFFPSFRTAKKTTYKPMTFFPVFGRQKKRHTNLWLFSQFSEDLKKTTYKPITFFPVFGRPKKRHTNLWLFYQFSDDLTNDIQTYDFFPSFPTAKKTTYKPMTFWPVFGRHKKRHTNLWLFYQFSDDIKNDIQTYDFFTSFPTT